MEKDFRKDSGILNESDADLGLDDSTPEKNTGGSCVCSSDAFSTPEAFEYLAQRGGMGENFSLASVDSLFLEFDPLFADYAPLAKPPSPAPPPPVAMVEDACSKMKFHEQILINMEIIKGCEKKLRRIVKYYENTICDMAEGRSKERKKFEDQIASIISEADQIEQDLKNAALALGSMEEKFACPVEFGEDLSLKKYLDGYKKKLRYQEEKYESFRALLDDARVKIQRIKNSHN